MKRKIFSIVLSLAMVFTMMSAVGAVSYAETSESGYLTFISSGETTVSFAHWVEGMDLQYSVDGGTTWAHAASDTVINLSDGNTVKFKGNAGDIFDKNHYLQFKMDGYGTITASGSVMSLFANKTECTSYCCYSMFSHCDNMIIAPKLPATTLAYNCYCCMFSDCKSLESAPELPAVVLAEHCYDCMFCDCTSMKTAPKLPAEVLVDSCYENMFLACKSLESAPELPAKTLAKACYYGMFIHCEGLTSVPKLPATILADECYAGMFADCTGIKMYSSYSVNHASEWSIPAGAEEAEDWNYMMFANTGGEFTEDPEVGVVYYQSKPDPVSSVKLSKTAFAYSGKTISPTVTVKTDSGKTLTKDTDYTVTYKNNKKVGKATVTITGNGDYKKTIKKTFKINPKKAIVAKAVPSKKKITVKMGTKVSSTGGATYQIAYKQKGISKWKYKTTTKKSIVIKNLKKGKKYYIKVRAYKTVSKTKYYGAWSKTKLSKKIK